LLPEVELFLDLYGFLSVVLHAAELMARSVLLGSIAFLAFLAAPLAFEQSRSALTALGASTDWAAAIAALAELEAQARGRLRVAGAADASVGVERHAEMRLAGQRDCQRVLAADEAACGGRHRARRT
jgi:hypothetical protein